MDGSRSPGASGILREGVSGTLPRPVTAQPASRAEHEAFLADRADVSFLQRPAWAHAVPAWRSVSVALCADGTVVGMAHVLLRPLPGTHALAARIPEGPVLDWSARPADQVLAPLVAHLRRRGAVSIRISPRIVVRRWSAGTLKAAMATGSARTLREVPADETDPLGAVVAQQLHAAGWRRSPPDLEAQARFQWQVPVSGLEEKDLHGRLSQEWRRGLRKESAAGVQVRRGGGAADLAAFAATHRATAARAGFPPWPDDHAARLAESFGDDFRMYVAEQDGDVLATSVVLRAGDGPVEPYVGSLQLPGRPSGVRSLEWQAITDARSEGLPRYDMRGIGESLDPAVTKAGMARFKAGTGGEAVEYLGEWDLPLRPVLHAAVLLGRRVVRHGATRRLRARTP